MWSVTFIRCSSAAPDARDRKSTRLNSSHSQISYAVFCLKKKKNKFRMQTHMSGNHNSIHRVMDLTMSFRIVQRLMHDQRSTMGESLEYYVKEFITHRHLQ